MTIGTSDGEQYTDSFEHYIDSLPSNLKPMLAGPSGKGTKEDGPYAPGEDARTPQMKSFGELTNYLSRMADPDKFRDAVSRMPESTNIDDRRNEDPIGNLIRKMKPLTNEDREQIKKDRALGKGGQLPVVDSEEEPSWKKPYTQEELDAERKAFRHAFENNYPANISPRNNGEIGKLFDLYREEENRWFNMPSEERSKILNENKRKESLDRDRFKMSPSELRKSIQEEQDKAKLKEESDRIKSKGLKF